MMEVWAPQCAFADTHAPLHLEGSGVVEKLKNKTDQPSKLNRTKKSQQTKLNQPMKQKKKPKKSPKTCKQTNKNIFCCRNKRLLNWAAVESYDLICHSSLVVNKAKMNAKSNCCLMPEACY